MARTGKWPARISLALSVAMIVAMFTGIRASGQQGSTAGILTVGKDVASASITQVTYSIVVANQGTAPITGTVVRDAVPLNTTFESSNPPPSATTSPSPGAASCANGGVRETDGTVCQWDLGTIPPGESRTITATYNLNQTNIASYRVTNTATARDNEGHENSDTDTSLVRQRVDVTDDTWVDDAEPANFNHGACNFLRVLQGNRTTSFIDADSFGTPPTSADATQTMERLWGAQLRAEVLDTTYTPEGAGVIGAHRITSGEWTEGGGTCQGSASTNTTDARTGAEPTSAPAPTGTTEVSSAAQVVNWDLTADLDTAEERGSFQGWELRDQAASGTDNSTRFHSKEASGDAQDPRIFLVFTTAEAASCLDADPENATNPPGTEHIMSAVVTDGVKQPTGTAPGSGTGPGGDACNGTPVPADVEWDLEGDTPDAYFSRQDGQPITKVIPPSGDAQPDQIQTNTGPDGITTAGISQNQPATGTNRVEVRIKGAPDDPDPPPTTPPNPTGGTCSPTPVPAGRNCSGETGQIDDVFKTWGGSASPSSASPTTTSPSPSGTSPSPSASSPSGSPSSPSGSPTSPSPTGTRSPASSSSAQQSSRTVSLFASPNEVVYPDEVTLSGQILSPDSSCDDANEFIQIRRRILGESAFFNFESQNTDAEGRFSITFASTVSAEYVAVAPAHDQCAQATSSPETVTVKVKITARAGRGSVERGSRVGIVGRVKPDHDGTRVVLQRKRGNKYVDAASVTLNGRSRYRFVIKVRWTGRRTFRVVWRAQDDEHEENTSTNVVIRGTRP